MNWLISVIGPYLVAGGGAIAALLGVWFTAKSKGRTQERQKQQETQRKAVVARKENDDEVHGMGDTRLNDELNRWVRNDRR